MTAVDVWAIREAERGDWETLTITSSEITEHGILGKVMSRLIRICSPRLVSTESW